jgi:hypothetical protein
MPMKYSLLITMTCASVKLKTPTVTRQTPIFMESLIGKARLLTRCALCILQATAIKNIKLQITGLQQQIQKIIKL